MTPEQRTAIQTWLQRVREVSAKWDVAEAATQEAREAEVIRDQAKADLAAVFPMILERGGTCYVEADWQDGKKCLVTLHRETTRTAAQGLEWALHVDLSVGSIERI